MGGGLVFEAGFDEDIRVDPVHDKQTLEVLGPHSQMKFKMVPKADFPHLGRHLHDAQSNADRDAITSARRGAGHGSAQVHPRCCEPSEVSGTTRRSSAGS